MAADGVTVNLLLRYGTAREFGAVAAFLASDGGAYVTGVALPVDGGLSRAIL